MTIWNQDEYTRAWRLACAKHMGQTVPGTNLPYVNHLANVAMEVMAAVAIEPVDNPTLAVLCALLHDTIEDAGVTFEDLESQFGKEVAAGVFALTKNSELPTKQERMADSLQRIKEQAKEVWIVKLADRIVNLQPPPAHWNAEKIAEYKAEACVILEELGEASKLLSSRLREKIKRYNT